jgi:hypothetical protein
VLPQTVTGLSTAARKKVGLDGKQRAVQVIYTGPACRGAGALHFIA